jgi:hypothetical protein
VTAPRAIPAPYHIWLCFDPASAELRIKSEKKAMAKIIDINFFHIWNLSFLLILSFL